MDNLGVPELIVILTFVLIAFAIMMVPYIFFILTLQKALNRCAAQNRTMPPGQAWLLLIPIFNLIWIFIVVTRIAATLSNEYRARQIPIEQNPGQAIGMAYAILCLCGVIPLIGIFAGLAGLVCWIIYWVKIAGYSSRLSAPAMQMSNA